MTIVTGLQRWHGRGEAPRKPHAEAGAQVGRCVDRVRLPKTGPKQSRKTPPITMVVNSAHTRSCTLRA